MSKKTSEEKINNIILLRKKGRSIPEISKKLEIPKTTVFRYVRDVILEPKYISFIKSKQGGQKRIKRLKELKALAQAKKFKNLSEREKLLILSALYWGEGTKKDFSLSNTDPNLIKVFVTFLREVHGIALDDLRVSVRIYEDLDREKCLSFWSEVVGISVAQIVNVNVLHGKKNGKLTYGMCRVRVRRGGDLLKKVVAINNTITKSLSP